MASFQENIHMFKLRQKFDEFSIAHKVKGPEALLVDDDIDGDLRTFRRLLFKEFRDFEKSLGVDYDSPANAENYIRLLDSGYMNQDSGD